MSQSAPSSAPRCHTPRPGHADRSPCTGHRAPSSWSSCISPGACPANPPNTGPPNAWASTAGLRSQPLAPPEVEEPSTTRRRRLRLGRRDLYFCSSLRRHRTRPAVHLRHDGLRGTCCGRYAGGRRTSAGRRHRRLVSGTSPLTPGSGSWPSGSVRPRQHYRLGLVFGASHQLVAPARRGAGAGLGGRRHSNYGY